MAALSIDVVELVDCVHHTLHRAFVFGTRLSSHLFSNLLTSIKHGVELADLVRVANFLEQLFYVDSCSGSHEVVLTYSKLSESRREQDVNCFRLVAVVLMVGN